MRPLAVVLALLACAAAPLTATYRAVGPGATAEGGARFEKDGVAVGVREVAGTERQALLGELAGATVDPFDVREEGGPRFRTFLLELRNQGAVEVFFNPSFATLHTGQDRFYPVGYTELYSFLSVALAAPGLLERFAPLLEETSMSVAPGMHLRQVLVFDRVPAKARDAVLVLHDIQVGREEMSVSLRFTRAAPR